METPHLAAKRIVLPQEILNAVPITRTPWGGSRIADIKLRESKGMDSGEGALSVQRIGESWEISTGNPFPSRLREPFREFPAGAPLQDVLARYPELLGKKVTQAVGAHSPLLLKWLHAQDVLSLQVHPALGAPGLKPHQEGKPESWLIMDCEPHGALYLGFREGFSREEIVNAFENGREREVLYRFQPRVGEYISVPPGCVHAIDAGVLIAEPQFVLPGKEGVTLRVSDWGRRYNAQGERDDNGSPREVHWEHSLETIDWSLPRGDALRSTLCHQLQDGIPYFPQRATPFPTVLFSSAGRHAYQDLVPDTYSVLTVWKGRCTLGSNGTLGTLRAGESAFLAPHSEPLAFELSEGLSTRLNRPLETSEASEASQTSPRVAAAVFSISIT